MKKILILLLLLIIITPCFAKTYTEEEFDEVYNALVETNSLLEEAETKISSLSEANQKLVDQLVSAKAELEKTYDLLDKAEKELRNSSKIINTLNNQKILIGGGIAFKSDFSSFNFGLKLNAGYKIWLGYIMGDLAYYNDKSISFGISYNLIF